MSRFNKLIVLCDIQKIVDLSFLGSILGWEPTSNAMWRYTSLAISLKTYFKTPLDRKSIFQAQEQAKWRYENIAKLNTIFPKDVKDKNKTNELP